MSVIGPGSIGAFNLAGSVAGAQRNNASSNESAGAASSRSNQIGQDRMTAQSMGDVAETDLSSDRDPDGRLQYQETPETESLTDEETLEQRTANRSPDAFGERGGSLDLEA